MATLVVAAHAVVGSADAELPAEHRMGAEGHLVLQACVRNALFEGRQITSYSREHFDVIPAVEARRDRGTLQRGDILLFKDRDSSGQHVGIFKGYDAENVSLRFDTQHGITKDDLIHAYLHPVDAFEQDDDFVMVIGPSASGRLLEVGVVSAVDYPGVKLIVHGMAARPRYLRFQSRPRRER